MRKTTKRLIRKPRSVWMNDQEYKDVCKLATKRGMSYSSYIRFKSLTPENNG